MTKQNEPGKEKMVQVYCSRLKFELDRKKFESDYDVYSIRSDQGKLPSTAVLFDESVWLPHVKAVFQTWENRSLVCYILTDKTRQMEFCSELQNTEAMQDEEFAETIRIQKENVSALKKYVILNLLLFALHGWESDEEDYEETQREKPKKPDPGYLSNLTGHCYFFRHSHQNKKLIKCLELRVDENLNLKMNVRSYLSWREWQKVPNKDQWKTPLVRYQINEDGYFVRCFDSKTKGAVYVNRAMPGTRARIPYLNVGKSKGLAITSFLKSKCGMLYEVVSEFNRVYSGLASLGFSSFEVAYEDNINKENSQQFKKLHMNLLKEAGRNRTIHLVDGVKTLQSKKLIEQLKKEIGKLGISSDLSSSVQNSLNIYLIHDRDAYSENPEDDIHQIYPDRAVQHITIENFEIQEQKPAKNEGKGQKRKAEPKVDSGVVQVLNQLFIKDDIRCGKIKLDRWKDREFDSDLIFASRIEQAKNQNQEEEQPAEFCLMTISPDGSLRFQTVSEFDSGPYEEWIAEAENEKAKKLVIYKGSMNMILDPGLITLPDLEKLYAACRSNNVTRGKSSGLLEYFAGVINLRKLPGNCFYAGPIGSGLNTSMENAPHIREIRQADGSQNLIDLLLPLMNVPFVNNDRLTSYPFPFAYLNEYIKRLNGQNIS